MSVSARVCPICARPVPPRAVNKAFPFCTKTCKLVDLGRWLDGTYRVPDGEAQPERDDAPPPKES
jgi:endogenous inhibitor of DNA gyrase (YacG/DUF329 family)